MKKLVLSAFIASSLFGGLAFAGDTAPADNGTVLKLGENEKWEQISDDKENTVYILGPVAGQEELKKDGLIIRVKDKKSTDDIVFQLRPGCEEKQLYITAGGDVAKDGAEVHNFTLIPASKDTVLKASNPKTTNGIILNKLCGK